LSGAPEVNEGGDGFETQGGLLAGESDGFLSLGGVVVCSETLAHGQELENFRGYLLASHLET
jgi:hypothetical protein